MEANHQHHRRNQRLNPNYEQLLANDNVIHAMGGTFLIRKSKLLDIVLRLPPLFLMDQVWKKEKKLFYVILHTNRKVKFLSKNSILTKLCNFLGKSKLSTTKKCKSPRFSRVFHPNFFWQFFSWNQSCQQLKSQKLQYFHEFWPKTIRQFFSGNESWIFGQKMKISNSVLIWFFIALILCLFAMVAQRKLLSLDDFVGIICLRIFCQQEINF